MDGLWLQLGPVKATRECVINMNLNRHARNMQERIGTNSPYRVIEVLNAFNNRLVRKVQLFVRLNQTKSVATQFQQQLFNGQRLLTLLIHLMVSKKA